MEAVLPIKIGVRSLKTVLESEISEADWLQSKYDQLCMLDEKRLKNKKVILSSVFSLLVDH